MQTLQKFFQRTLLRSQLSPLEKQYQRQIEIDEKYIDYPLQLIFFFFIIFEIIRALIAESLFKGPVRWDEIIPRIAYSILISFPLFGGRILKKNQSSFYPIFRKIGITIATFFYCVLTAAINIWRADDFVTYYDNHRDRFDFISFGFFMVLNVIVSDLIFHKWIHKCIIPMCDLTSLFYAVVKHRPLNPLAVLSYIIILIIYIVTFFWLKERLRWEIFLHRRSLNEWNQIHEEILKNIPDNIAVYDFNGKILFENNDFKNLRNGIIRGNDNIIDAIVRVKKRKSFESSQSFIENEYSNPSDADIETIDQEAEYLLQSIQSIDNSLLNTKIFANLGLVFKIVQRLYLENKINNKDLLVFDGKYFNEATRENHSLEIKLVVFEDPQGGSKKLLVILRDTTQRDLISILESNNKFKDNMIDSISHELRTPLNGFTNILECCKRDQEVAKEIKENYITPALTSARILSHIVDDILDYSLLLKNKLHLKFQRVEIIDLLQGCHKLINRHYNQQNINFRLEVDHMIPKYIQTDPDRLKRALINLLSNAFKFTRKGNIFLKARMEGTNLRIIISDTGIGMNAQTISRLVTIFFESLNGKKVSDSSTGVGLGITLSQYITYYLGPNENSGLYFASKQYRGSIFTFLVENKRFTEPNLPTIPYYKIPPLKRLSSKAIINEELLIKLEESVQESISNSERSHIRIPSLSSEDFDIEDLSEDTRAILIRNAGKYLPSKRSRKKTYRAQIEHPEILVVDDEPINVLALEMLFKQLGKSIDKAYGGEEAIQLIKRRRSEMRLPCPKVYKMVFVDLNMPALDGFETTKIIKEMIKNNQIEDMVIVACTAYPECEYKPKCLEAGMSEFINKPVTRNKIVGILKKYNCL